MHSSPRCFLALPFNFVAPEPEIETQEPASTEAQDITIHPQPAVEEGGPETVTEETPVTVTESVAAQSVLPDEPEAVETNTLPGAATSEQPDTTADASIEPVTAKEEDSAATVDEESTKDAPIAVEETSTEPVTVDEEPAKDAPVPIEETPAQSVAVETPSTPVEAPSTPGEAPSTLQAPSRPTERRGSSVLARVRAMESPKPPGSFD